ncbi:MAG: cell division protein ZapD, partial [Methylococcales bacterium]|nr:cell division protein ZapD [Methylococcales bacterium]
QINYEFPLNERIRVFMRLEQLFIELKHFLESETVLDKRVVMKTLLDISMIFNRNNIKSELFKESERLLTVLNVAPKDFNSDNFNVEDSIKKLTDFKDMLHSYHEKIGATLAKNHLFQSFAQRSMIPGGTYSFDLPSYHYWLLQAEKTRLDELHEWVKPFLDMYDAIDLVLSLIRIKGAKKQEIAEKGFFQLTLKDQGICQLLQIQVPQNAHCFAEISGGRHRFTVRFMQAALKEERPTQTKKDVEFALTCCYL